VDFDLGFSYSGEEFLVIYVRLYRYAALLDEAPIYPLRPILAIPFWIIKLAN